MNSLLKNNSIETFMHLCKKFHPETNNNNFSWFIKTSLLLFHISKEKLSMEFEASPFSIERWAEGDSRPHPRLQGMIVEYIHEELMKLYFSSKCSLSHIDFWMIGSKEEHSPLKTFEEFHKMFKGKYFNKEEEPEKYYSSYKAGWNYSANEQQE